ncbi:TrgA family protein [Roseivivax sp. CAU 1761]
MPTAAKLVAALLLAGLGYLASEAVKPLVPAITEWGRFSLINAGIGLLCGWIVIGSRAGRGMSAAVSNGITGVVALVFWALVVQALAEMVDAAFKGRFSGMGDAISDVFNTMIEHAAILADGSLLMLLIGGALLVGGLSEIAARHWR